MRVVKFIATLVVAVVLWPLAGYAYDIKDLNHKIQTKQLPSWCNYVQRGNGWGGKKSQKYIDKFGNDWMAMHHSCWGLDRMNLALKKGRSHEFFNNQMRYAIQEFNYVLDRVKNKDLRVMALVQKAKAQSYAGDNNGAIQSYVSIINTDKSKESAYILLSNAYLKLNKREKARETLMIGLKNNPQSIILKKQLNQLN